MNHRPRFAPPIALEKIRMDPKIPSMAAMLENIVSVAPMNLPIGQPIGIGIGPKKVNDAPIVPSAVQKGPIKPKAAAIMDEYMDDTDVVEVPDIATPAVIPTATPAPTISEIDQLQTIEEVKPVVGLNELEQRVQTIMQKNPVLIRPDAFVPNNRRKFKQFIIQTYRRYLLPKPPAIPDPDACLKSAEASKSEVKSFQYQAFVRDYIQKPSPYRGVLVYHGLGSGKTCTSIASMAALYAAGQKPVYIFTPASLSKNYRDEITKCGPFIFKTNNFWQWIPITVNGRTIKRTPESDFLLNVMKLPRSLIEKQRGAWVPDPAKKPNFDSLRTDQRKQIQDQIYAHINHRFIFIHYNGLLEKTVREWACKDPKKFDGATIVIDEVHNLIRTINNSHLDIYYKDEPREMDQYLPVHCAVGRKYRISYLLYRMLCNAVGCKIIALSGTPIINYPHEIAILSNILAGDTRMAEATMSGLEDRKRILSMLERHPEVDFAEIVPRPETNDSLVRITPVPSGCRKVIDPETGAFRGFVRDEEIQDAPEEMDRERNLLPWFQRVIAGTGIQNPKFRSVSRLPDVEKTFREMFIDTEQLAIKPSAKLPLMARLSGLISYYKGGKADLMARVTKDIVVELDMSDLQLKEYTAVRKEEIEKEQRELKRKPTAVVGQDQKGPTLYDQVTKTLNSTFKIFSRAACNFAFPSDMDRPRPSDFRDLLIDVGFADADKKDVMKGETSTIGTIEDDFDDEKKLATIEAEEKKAKTSAYDMAIQAAIQELKDRADEFFSRETLPRYSPKFQAIINNIQESRGPVLVYSQFKTLEGIGLFSLALQTQLKYRKFDIVPSAGGWDLSDETRTAPAGTFFYITYTGDEDAEKRNILKAVFNAAWNKMPANLAAQIKELTGADNNQLGRIAKIFMITQSGAEGISLSNVRQVHIMEPYWNYVRLDQVKGRAIRICSHMDLPVEERTVDVFTYISKFSKEQLTARLVDETLLNFDGGATTDQSVLQLSNAKKKLADALFEVMQSSAVDCELNANENGTLACYRFAGDPSMEPMFHPLVHVHLAEEAAVVHVR